MGNGNRFIAWSWSPDGNWLAGFIMEGGTYAEVQDSAIVVYSMETQKYRKVTDFGTGPNWLSDSRRLLFPHQSAIYVADIETGETRELFSLPRDLLLYPTVSSDGQWLYIMRQETESDICMLTLNEDQQ
jgi:Tol biopolymer transport system component